MTGENFLRLNRSRDTKLEDALQAAKVAFTDYARAAKYDDDWNWDTFRALENKVERLDFLVAEQRSRRHA